MRVLHWIVITTLSTGCGAASDAAKKADTDTAVAKDKGTVPAHEPDKDKEETKVAQPEKVEKVETVAKPAQPAQLTKDQMLRASIRLGFDHFLGTGKLFHDESFKAYFYKGDEGAMGYPDSQYLPVTTKNISLGCPLGFKQVGQIDLSIAISHGLFNVLPPESAWIWTSWKGTADINAYSAYAVDDLTDQWGYHFDGGFFYPRHRSRQLGRLYCMMSDSDLPNVDDLPEGYFATLGGNAP